MIKETDVLFFDISSTLIDERKTNEYLVQRLQMPPGWTTKNALESCPKNIGSELLEIAMKKAETTPSRSVMTGDYLDNDIVPAKSLGMKTIWIKQGSEGFLQSAAIPKDWTILQTIFSCRSSWITLLMRIQYRHRGMGNPFIYEHQLVTDSEKLFHIRTKNNNRTAL